MLVKPPLEKLLPKVDNRYVLAILVAKRARQLVDGAQPLMDTDSPNLVTVACEELASNRITLVRGNVNPYIPLRPEIEAARLAARTAAAHASMADAVKDALDQAAGLGDDLDESDAGLIAESIMSLPAETDDDDAVAFAEDMDQTELERSLSEPAAADADLDSEDDQQPELEATEEDI
jgi:DNA-directed RNA polymerase subunit omega